MTSRVLGSHVTSGRSARSSLGSDFLVHAKPLACSANAFSAAVNSLPCVASVWRPTVSAWISSSSVSFDQSALATVFWSSADLAAEMGFAELPSDTHNSRNRNCAVRPTCSAIACSLWPGISMMIWSPPCVDTSASVTPVALTRCSMIDRASASFSGSGVLPLSDLGLQRDARAALKVQAEPRRPYGVGAGLGVEVQTDQNADQSPGRTRRRSQGCAAAGALTAASWVVARRAV